MKSLNTLLLLSICSILSAKIFFVAPSTATPAGNDNNPGTIHAPWATWGKAFNSTVVGPGDTVYFRGGIYYKDLRDGEDDWYYPERSIGGTGYGISRDGKPGSYIHYFAYPPDFNEGNPPILDNFGVVNTLSNLSHGIRTIGVNHVKFWGLHIRNVQQVSPKYWAEGWKIYGNDVIIENCKVYNVHGAGFVLGSENGSDTTYVINCDAYNCCDSLTVWNPETLDGPGNDGSGFRHASNGAVYYINCRAWLCGDQGFSNGIDDEESKEQYTDYEGCWGFYNGMMTGGGHGFKMGWIRYTDGNLKRTYKNCLSAFNRLSGFKTNDYKNNNAIYVNIYNCISYHNGYHKEFSAPYGTYGFDVNGTPDTEENELHRTLKNNISYDNENGSIALIHESVYSHSNNTWDSDVKVTTADFVGPIDSATIHQSLIAPRKVDGSLPDFNFFNLADSSSLIDAGIDVGLPYNGDSPDIGAFEHKFQSEKNNIFPNVDINLPVNGTKFIAPASITISAKASDVDGFIEKVIFLNGTTKLGEKTTSPWSFTWNNVPAGNYSLKVIAVDNLNAEATSSSVKIQVIDNSPPYVEITSPSDGTEFIASATITITANAYDNDGSVDKVEYFNGATKIGEITVFPWSFNWNNVTTGNYSLKAVATDNLNARSTSSTVDIHVLEDPNTNIHLINNYPPSIEIKSPLNGAEFFTSSTITINASANDIDGSIDRVKFFQGTTKLGEKSKPPWSFIWNNVPAGNYSLIAVAIDNSGAEASSDKISIIVNDSCSLENKTPFVSIIHPTGNGSYKEFDNINIDVFASDPDGTIIKVEFYHGENFLAESKENPYSYTWENIQKGVYSITAVATDNLDATTVSSPVLFEVVAQSEVLNDHDVNIFNLFPNPNDGYFTLFFNNPEKDNTSQITVNIMTLDGKFLYMETLKKNEITKHFNLSYLKPGTYLLKIVGKNLSTAKTFIKE